MGKRKLYFWGYHKIEHVEINERRGQRRWRGNHVDIYDELRHDNAAGFGLEVSTMAPSQ